MGEFWVPMGTVYFPGSYMELMRVIGSIYGVQEDENTFRCNISFPRKNHNSIVRVRGHISFLFRCTIERQVDSCKITYKVYPAFTSAILLLLPLYVFISGVVSALLHRDLADLLANSSTGIGLFCPLIGLFLLARHFCIRQFVRKFEEEHESNYD